MLEISPAAMAAFEESSVDAFIKRLLRFLRERFGTRIDRVFVEHSVDRGRKAQITSEQDLATLTSILWVVATEVRGDSAWVGVILDDGALSGPEKVEQLKNSLRMRLGA